MSDRSQQIAQLYQNLLGRAPDTSGLEYWAGTNLPLTSIRNMFLGSPEYVRRHSSGGYAHRLSKAGKENLGYTSDWYKYLIDKTKGQYDPLVDTLTKALNQLEPQATANAQYGMDIAKNALSGQYPSIYDTWMNDIIRNAHEQALRDMQYNQRQNIGDVLNNLAQRGALSSSVNVNAQRQIGESANRNLANLTNRLYQWKGNTQLGLPQQMQNMGQSLAQNATNIMKPKTLALGSTLESRGDLLGQIAAGQGLIDAARSYPSMMDPYLKDISYAQSAYNLANAPLTTQSSILRGALTPIMSGSAPAVNIPSWGNTGVFSGLGGLVSDTLGKLFPSNTTNISRYTLPTYRSGGGFGDFGYFPLL